MRGLLQTRSTQPVDDELPLLNISIFILPISFQICFSLSDSSNDICFCDCYSFLMCLNVCSCVASCSLAVILGLTLRDMMTFLLRPQDITALTTLKV